MPGTSSSAERRVAILGGTFDPPHIGHLVLAECVRVQFDVEQVVFMPAGDPYRKAARRVTPAENRLAMTRLAIADNEHFSVDDREIRRQGPTFTVDTLEALAGEGLRRPILVLGVDAVADMPNWKSPGRIVELAEIVVTLKWLAKEPDWPPFFTTPPAMVDMPPLAISGTEIRARVAASKPIRYLVPDAVRRYIEDHHLYREGRA